MDTLETRLNEVARIAVRLDHVRKPGLPAAARPLSTTARMIGPDHCAAMFPPLSVLSVFLPALAVRARTRIKRANKEQMGRVRVRQRGGRRIGVLKHTPNPRRSPRGRVSNLRCEIKCVDGSNVTPATMPSSKT
jgi:hypothetical protein